MPNERYLASYKAEIIEARPPRICDVRIRLAGQDAVIFTKPRSVDSCGRQIGYTNLQQSAIPHPFSTRFCFDTVRPWRLLAFPVSRACRSRPPCYSRLATE